MRHVFGHQIKTRRVKLQVRPFWKLGEKLDQDPPYPLMPVLSTNFLTSPL